MSKGRKLLGMFIMLIVIFSAIRILTEERDEREEQNSAGLKLVAQGLTAPVGIISPQDGTGRLFIIFRLLQCAPPGRCAR